jgi:hypothetical protein
MPNQCAHLTSAVRQPDFGRRNAELAGVEIADALGGRKARREAREIGDDVAVETGGDRVRMRRRRSDQRPERGRTEKR